MKKTLIGEEALDIIDKDIVLNVKNVITI